MKEFLEKKIASVVAKAGFRSIPVVGPAVGLVEDGVELVNDFKDHEDGLTTALDAASLVVNGASIFPPFQAAAQPLKVIIGIGEGLNETVQFVGFRTSASSSPAWPPDGQPQSMSERWRRKASVASTFCGVLSPSGSSR